mmetsp:Transcript_69904/g.194411  ORF Transcript_69904/g.194411 Transcript_69904/m.194411 type:complete len:280 (+) Transcript_69904:140-979(+)
MASTTDREAPLCEHDHCVRLGHGKHRHGTSATTFLEALPARHAIRKEAAPVCGHVQELVVRGHREMQRCATTSRKLHARHPLPRTCVPNVYRRAADVRDESQAPVVRLRDAADAAEDGHTRATAEPHDGLKAGREDVHQRQHCAIQPLVRRRDVHCADPNSLGALGQSRPPDDAKASTRVRRDDAIATAKVHGPVADGEAGSASETALQTNDRAVESFDLAGDDALDRLDDGWLVRALHVQHQCRRVVAVKRAIEVRTEDAALIRNDIAVPKRGGAAHV